MMRQEQIRRVYGADMPVWDYMLTWSCGCFATTSIESLTPIPDLYVVGHECPECYTGPTANVFD